MPSPSATPFHGIHMKTETAQLTVLPKPKPNEYTAADPKPIMEQLIPKLRQEADYVIVLAHYPRQNASAILQNIQGIDLLIAGYGQADEPQIKSKSGMTTISPGYNGRAIGRLSLYRDASSPQVQAKGEVVPVNDQLDHDAEIRKLLEAYKEDTKKLPKPDMAPTKYTLAGAENCRQCHQASHAQWKTQRHAHAFATLSERNQHFNPECLPCHTTYYLKDNGFRDITNPNSKNYTDVQCEVCHGPSLHHAINEKNLLWGVNFEESQKARIREQIKATMPIKKPEKKVCLECHTDKTDPKFNYEEKIKLVSHEDPNPGPANAPTPAAQ